MSFYGETWESWDDPFASDGPCPWGGFGNYQLLDPTCEWQCHFRKACMKLKKEARQRAQGEIWRRLFYTEGMK